MRTLTLLTLLAGCHTAIHTTPASLPEPGPAVDLDAPGPIVLQTHISATWAVPRSGLIDLTDPRAADLPHDKMPIVLPVHVLTHPEHGAFLVDTGVPATDDPTRGLVRRFARDIEPVAPLAEILGTLDGPLSGVLLTHTHLDHVLGLPDVPAGVPVHAGAGEEAPVGLNGALTFPTFRRALGDRPLTLWDFEEAPALESVDHAIDVLGDGSLWALSVPGHTPGSTAYLARTTEGPVLFTGDCSHTHWGWEHDVTPGTYTQDHARNATSLAQLRALAAAHPTLRVEVGHEPAREAPASHAR